MNIYQSSTYREDLRWRHFEDEPRVQDRLQVKDRQSCISAFAAYLAIIYLIFQKSQPTSLPQPYQ